MTAAVRRRRPRATRAALAVSLLAALAMTTAAHPAEGGARSDRGAAGEGWRPLAGHEPGRASGHGPGREPGAGREAAREPARDAVEPALGPPAGGPVPEPSAQTWVAPVSGYPVSAAYGVPGDWLAGRHTGVDFATPVGVPVRQVGPGTVVLAGDAGNYGRTVITHMPDGHYVLYAHLSRVAVEEGQQLDGGSRVGDTGDTGRSTGPHLHFEVRTGREYGTDTDPLEYLAGHGVEILTGPDPGPDPEPEPRPGHTRAPAPGRTPAPHHPGVPGVPGVTGVPGRPGSAWDELPARPFALERPVHGRLHQRAEHPPHR
ncbi:murein hydrolase activator EnvC [Streptomyces sp. YIM 98790]|uniref:murein hydrolase activator EnvC family protein n=1 Tax=Streptomyces sp. YIM 98790 TaxID=2689077 RepID=UPI001FB6B3FE|nr:M23 family metallopeptidase [Streptomyces sp. YIM 98790]